MSNSTSPESELPNPFTSLAFLPPDLASQYEVSRYLYAVTLGGYLWDIAVNLDSDYKLLFRHRIRYPTIVYYLSRVSTLAYIITSFIFQVGNVPDCQALQVALGVCNVLSQAFTSLLFLFRVAAVWHGNITVVIIFAILWLGVVGSALTVPLGTKGIHIGTTKNCINAEVKDFTEASVIAPMINDSAVFVAITLRILQNASVSDGHTRIKAFFGKRGLLPALSENLLLGGQHYYLAALCGNIVTLVLVRLPGVPAVYRAMCTIPVLAVVNAMACLVYRKIKFGLISPDGTSTINAGSGSNANSFPLQLRRSHWRGDPEYGQASNTLGRTTQRSLPVEVHIVKELDAFDESRKEELNSSGPLPHRNTDEESS